MTHPSSPPPAPPTGPAGSVGAGQRNAARSAQQHLAISDFSRSGLIEQLQYEGHSPDQAAYGATAVGL